MKKDIEWLKDKIKDEEYNLKYVYNNFVPYEKVLIADDVYDLIKQLDEPETLSQEWIDENKVERIDNLRKMTTSDVVTVENLKNILVPKQDDGFVVFEKDKLDEEVQRMIDETYKAMNEKPVIPQFVADWIDVLNLHGNNPLREYRDLETDFDEGWTDEEGAEVYHWINKNPYAFIDALRYGYEVEKEKLYHVVNKENYFMLRKYDGLVDVLHVSSSMSRDEYGKDPSFMLTEKEIKGYDKRFWAFAEEVTQ